MAGYWKGSATDLESDRRLDAVALIDAQGEAQWLLTREDRDEDDDEDGFVLYGNVCCDARFEDDLAGKELGETRTREASIDAALDGGRLTGEIEFRGREYRFTLDASAEYDRNLTLQSLAGVYTRTESSWLGEQTTLTLTIDANGQLTGSYSNGCVFNGDASIPDAGHNMVRLQIDLANCGDRRGSSEQWNGAYTGSGVLLLDAVSADNGGARQDVLYHSIVGPTWLGPQPVAR